MRMLQSISLVATLAGCTAQGQAVHLAGERLEPPPEARAPPPPGPPPPRVVVTMVFAPSLPAAVARSSTALLNSLDGMYLSLTDGAVEPAAVSHCSKQAAGASGCVESVLAATQSAKGTVVILVSTRGRGMATWTCVGRPVAPFDVTHQVVDWPHSQALGSPNPAWPRGVQQAAASCITYAGRQSGW